MVKKRIIRKTRKVPTISKSDAKKILFIPHMLMHIDHNGILGLAQVLCGKHFIDIDKQNCLSNIPWQSLIQRDTMILELAEYPPGIAPDFFQTVEKFNKQWGTDFKTWAEAYYRLDEIDVQEGSIIVYDIDRSEIDQILNGLVYRDRDEELSYFYNDMTRNLVISLHDKNLVDSAYKDLVTYIDHDTKLIK